MARSAMRRCFAVCESKMCLSFVVIGLLSSAASAETYSAGEETNSIAAENNTHELFTNILNGIIYKNLDDDGDNSIPDVDETEKPKALSIRHTLSQNSTRILNKNQSDTTNLSTADHEEATSNVLRDSSPEKTFTVPLILTISGQHISANVNFDHILPVGQKNVANYSSANISKFLADTVITDVMSTDVLEALEDGKHFDKRDRDGPFKLSLNYGDKSSLVKNMINSARNTDDEISINNEVITKMLLYLINNPQLYANTTYTPTQKSEDAEIASAIVTKFKEILANNHDLKTMMDKGIYANHKSGIGNISNVQKIAQKKNKPIQGSFALKKNSAFAAPHKESELAKEINRLDKSIKSDLIPATNIPMTDKVLGGKEVTSSEADELSVGYDLERTPKFIFDPEDSKIFMDANRHLGVVPMTTEGPMPDAKPKLFPNKRMMAPVLHIAKENVESDPIGHSNAYKIAVAGVRKAFRRRHKNMYHDRKHLKKNYKIITY